MIIQELPLILGQHGQSLFFIHVACHLDLANLKSDLENNAIQMAHVRRNIWDHDLSALSVNAYSTYWSS